MSGFPSSRRVAFVPGEAFHATGGGANTMRINFSYSNPATIREGITRLGLTLKELLHDRQAVPIP